jgi:hypothetical protein
VPQVIAQKTPYVAPVIAGAYVWAYAQVTGHTPVSQASYLMPMAQGAVESGYFRSMYNNNPGNVTAGNPASQDWVFEYPGSHRFRAYATLGQGVLDQLQWLHKHGCLPFADANDLGGYVSALQRGCYVGCPPEGDMAAYQNGIATAMHKYNGITPVPYSESSFIPSLSNLTPMKALLLAGGILAVAGGVAYVIHEGYVERGLRQLAGGSRGGRRGARDNPLPEGEEDEAPQGLGEAAATHVQSLLFPRDTYDAAAAKAWARSHGYHVGKVDTTPDFIRLRQAHPGRFTRLRTINFGKKSGIKAVVGR